MLQVDEQIETIERLRELLPTEGFTNTFLKVSDRLNDVARKFIEKAPFVIVATKASEGLIDVSPKGDPAGFVECYDDKTLIIPDRLGNHRVGVPPVWWTVMGLEIPALQRRSFHS